ncbi:hypothetical protein BU15DRAFT_73620 [Melanogaster broomeanus]|nr:hypothetical protein BU15DRAFT_73620 [Melanogaster broomeanus]
MLKLDRQVDHVWITNDEFAPLRANVVIQLQTIRGSNWKEHERRFEGFKGGGSRSNSGKLVFLFSTSKDRGFTPTRYQTFVTDIRKVFSDPNAIEIIRPAGGKVLWTTAYEAAEMFEQTTTRKAESGRSEPPVMEPPVRFPTPCSSISVKSRTSRPDSKPSNSDSGPSVPPRRSVRYSVTQTINTSPPPPPPPPPPPEPDELILMYPPTGTGALSIMRTDLRRLGPEEYLNDTLIEFGLKLWLNDLREKDPALADQIHVFSSFFYKKLNNKKNPEDGYQSVRKWTSKVNLFSKKYVIVPIHENVHWYLALIYEPGYTLEPPLPPTSSPSARTTRKRNKEQEHAGDGGETVVQEEAVLEPDAEQSSSTAQTSDKEAEVNPSAMNTTRATTPSMTEDEEMGDVSISAFDKSCSITAVPKPVSATSSKTRAHAPSSLPDLQWPPSDPMDVDADTLGADPNLPSTETTEVPGSSTFSRIPVVSFYGPGSKKGKEKAVDKAVVNLDSEDGGDDQEQEAEVDDMLAVSQSQTTDIHQTYIFTLDSLGSRHPQAIRVLRKYLEREAKDKKNVDEVRDAVGKQVQVPVQPNTWDCGIYLLHFMKVFMKVPEDYLQYILSTKGTIPSAERKKRWHDGEVPQFRDYLISRINELSEIWMAEKAAREGAAKKRKNEEAELLSSEGEIDIVEDVSEVKVTRRLNRNVMLLGSGDDAGGFSVLEEFFFLDILALIQSLYTGLTHSLTLICCISCEYPTTDIIWL